MAHTRRDLCRDPLLIEAPHGLCPRGRHRALREAWGRGEIPAMDLWAAPSGPSPPPSQAAPRGSRPFGVAYVCAALSVVGDLACKTSS